MGDRERPAEGADRRPGGRIGNGRTGDGSDGPTTQEFRITLDGVSLRRGRREVFRKLSCGMPRAGVTVVLGGSGVGKSTLLRLIGGLERPDEGSVRVADQDLSRLSKRELFQARERIGMLFQGGALLDSMTLFDNVALPLREHTQLDEADIASAVRRRLADVGLPDTEDMYPRQLSGGMVRRAALARAVVLDPEVVLCDEPFSGLDPVNVRRIENLLLGLNQRLSITLVVTSHHIPSALRMADRILFLVEGGAISGTPQNILASTDPRVVEFLSAESDDLVRPGGADSLRGAG